MTVLSIECEVLIVVRFIGGEGLLTDHLGSVEAAGGEHPDLAALDALPS